MRWVLIPVLAAALAGVPAAQQKQQKAAPRTTLTGCIDEEPGSRYVLLGSAQLNKKAELKPQGFANESFAKYLGHQVKVTGTLESDGDPAVFRVRSVERISEICAPDEPPAK